MKKLLITGFDCFDAHLLNPSWEAVRRLPDTVGEYRLCRLMLHTLYEKAAEELLRVAEDYKPDVIISVGQAGGRDAVTPERIAVNIRAARTGDNDGVILDGDRIVTDGPAAYFSTLPVEAMRDAIRAAGIPSSVSNTAGAFVCNDVMYSALHRYAGTPVRCGFIHVPYLPEQGQPNMSLDRTIAALIAAIEVL